MNQLMKILTIACVVLLAGSVDVHAKNLQDDVLKKHCRELLDNEHQTTDLLSAVLNCELSEDEEEFASADGSGSSNNIDPRGHNSIPGKGDLALTSFNGGNGNGVGSGGGNGSGGNGIRNITSVGGSVSGGAVCGSGYIEGGIGNACAVPIRTPQVPTICASGLVLIGNTCERPAPNGPNTTPVRPGNGIDPIKHVPTCATGLVLSGNACVRPGSNGPNTPVIPANQIKPIAFVRGADGGVAGPGIVQTNGLTGSNPIVRKFTIKDTGLNLKPSLSKPSIVKNVVKKNDFSKIDADVTASVK